MSRKGHLIDEKAGGIAVARGGHSSRTEGA
jgi:hypothetical protein